MKPVVQHIAVKLKLKRKSSKKIKISKRSKAIHAVFGISAKLNSSPQPEVLKYNIIPEMESIASTQTLDIWISSRMLSLPHEQEVLHLLSSCCISQIASASLE